MSEKKPVEELIFDENARYSREHTWVRTEGGRTVVGISDFAQDQLGVVIFVDLPEPGDTFSAGDEFGVVESAKSTSELYMPVGGEVTAVNTVLEDQPGLINDSPYGDGWMIEVRPDGSEAELLGRDEYAALLKAE